MPSDQRLRHLAASSVLASLARIGELAPSSRGRRVAIEAQLALAENGSLIGAKRPTSNTKVGLGTGGLSLQSIPRGSAGHEGRRKLDRLALLIVVVHIESILRGVEPTWIARHRS